MHYTMTYIYVLLFQAIVAAAMAATVGDDDDYAICSVESATCGRLRCLQPNGEEVNWVQCDGGCEEWFHCLCVVISASEARNSEYICEACRLFPKPPSVLTA